MRLLDFIQQDDRIGRPADTLRQLPALFVAHIPRRRADELRNGVFLHELRHIEAYQRLLRTEQEFRKPASDFRFADARGTQEEETTDGAQWRLETGAAAANGA